MLLNTSRNRYITILALIATLILIVGWQLRPQKASDVPMSQADLTRLARLSQKSTLDGMANYFADVARQVDGGMVWVEGLQATGLVWDPSGTVLVATASPNPYLRGALRGSDDGEVPLQTELYSDPLSFRMLKSPPEMALESLRQASSKDLRTGNWLVRVWKTASTSFEFEPGLFSSTRPLSCGGVEVLELLSSFEVGPRSLGSAVFDLEGRLAGVALHCSGSTRMIAADSMSRAVDRARAVDSQIQFRYGFLPAELTDRSRAYFGITSGLLVKEVWRDTLAWNLGVRPGDVVTMLDVDPANRLEDLAMMTVPMYRPEYELTIRRGRASRKVTFPPGAGLADEPEGDRRATIAFQDTPTGVGIRHIEPGSAAAIAGLRAGDRIVSMGPQFGVGRIDPTQINAPRDTPLFLVVEREERLLGLFLE